MQNVNRQIIINYSAAAIIFWLAAITFSALIRIVLRNVLIVNEADPALNFWVNACSEMFIVLLLTRIYLRTLRKRPLESGKTFRKILTSLLLLLVGSIVLQFIFPFTFDYWGTGHADAYAKYNTWINRSFYYECVDLVLYMLKYTIVFLMMIRRIAKPSDTTTPS